jgi:hypothetical protein
MLAGMGVRRANSLTTGAHTAPKWDVLGNRGTGATRFERDWFSKSVAGAHFCPLNELSECGVAVIRTSSVKPAA